MIEWTSNIYYLLFKKGRCLLVGGTEKDTRIMKLIDDLINDLHDGDTTVSDVLIGHVWIGVMSRLYGVAKNCGEAHEYLVRDLGSLTEKTALELAEYAKSWNMLEASVGLAAINSLIEPRGARFNYLEFLIDHAEGKRIAMVGHFPMADKLKARSEELWILERQPKKGDLPDTASEYVIPKADTVVITSSAIINKSIERLLELSQGLTILLGPSTPMSEVLFDYGVDVLAGIRVRDEAGMMRKIAQGGGKVKQFEDVIDFLVLER